MTISNYNIGEIYMDGVLIVKKEEGYTSHDVVNRVKKILNEKVGHTGTLDPLATGVLPLLIRKRYKSIKVSYKS